ncbi:MAG: hypothetical protein EBZ48_07920 [Proteobacteria bacterium]|nr:hypothetical protein [Pseudomonadota bacterium]
MSLTPDEKLARSPKCLEILRLAQAASVVAKRPPTEAELQRFAEHELALEGLQTSAESLAELSTPAFPAAQPAQKPKHTP